ncbi:MAG: 30S ribosomal protein S12 methylthiotransferase RimO, partial [Clostridia bacterium]|nr:30S ribosomal protein S12 methylthiotransferase RimO [Clostridia bacterium]
MEKIAFVSLGCPKNLVDTEYMLGALASEEYCFTEDESEADIIVVNTCCFINDAKQESIDTIIDVGQWKNDGNCKRLIVTGCLAQRYKDEIIKELPEVDAVVGVGDVEGVLNAVKSTETIVDCNKEYCLESPYKRAISTPHYVAYLKVADGCDNHCTYCVIPSIRGKLQSKPIEKCVEEARDLARNGVFELVLLAQDLTNYGKDLYGTPKLVELLKELGKIDGIKWIRLLYCYPESITDELVQEIANNDKICKYIDIPIQHCNNEILKKMGRRGNKETIVSVINKLRDNVPGITIRTTLITGFPGETDDQYLEMEKFIQEMKFDRLGVFAYSQEENTPAANMPDQV